MVVSDDVKRLVKERDPAQHPHTLFRVTAHLGPLLLCQPSRRPEDRVRHRQLADVVQQEAVRHLRVACLARDHLSREQQTEPAHALDVAAGRVILRLDRGREGLDGDAIALRKRL